MGYKNNKSLHKQIVQILIKHDPAGVFYADENNTDEYNPEADKIIQRLSSCKSQQDVQMLAYEVFIEMFGDDVASPRDKYEKLANEIWACYCEL